MSKINFPLDGILNFLNVEVLGYDAVKDQINGFLKGMLLLISLLVNIVSLSYFNCATAHYLSWWLFHHLTVHLHDHVINIFQLIMPYELK